MVSTSISVTALCLAVYTNQMHHAANVIVTKIHVYRINLLKMINLESVSFGIFSIYISANSSIVPNCP